MQSNILATDANESHEGIMAKLLMPRTAGTPDDPFWNPEPSDISDDKPRCYGKCKCCPKKTGRRRIGRKIKFAKLKITVFKTTTVSKSS
jgi:hypothetical protein